MFDRRNFDDATKIKTLLSNSLGIVMWSYNRIIYNITTSNVGTENYSYG